MAENSNAGYKGELTPLERRLVTCAAAGEELDCAPKGVTEAELDEIDDWDERKIRAEVIVALCTREVSDWSVHPRRGLRLRGAYVVGLVDLSRAQLNECPFDFHTCRFEQPVLLYQATTADMGFASCDLPGLLGDQLNSSASLALIKTHLGWLSLRDAHFRSFVGLIGAQLVSPGEGEFALFGSNLSAAYVVLRDNAHVEGEVNLQGAQISHQLICSNVHLSNPAETALSADGLNAAYVFLINNTQVEGEVRLAGAQISGRLDCSDIYLRNPSGDALSADSLNAAYVRLRGAKVEGAVRLVGAKISGALDCDGAQLLNSDGRALSADGLNTPAVFLRDNAKVEGEVSLSGAQISGALDCSGAHLSNPGGYALLGYSLNASNVYLRGAKVEGEVILLQGAQISGSLDCDGAQLLNPDGRALSADGLNAGDVFLRDNAKVEGEVYLVGTKIGGDLDCGGAHLSNPGGSAFAGRQCQVGGMLCFRLAERAAGKVDLSFANVGPLVDNLASWPDTFNLRGFSYRSLGGDDTEPRQRLRWLGQSEPFSPDVYTQLAEVYRQTGHEGYARQVAIAREKERTRQPDLSWWVRA